MAASARLGAVLGAVVLAVTGCSHHATPKARSGDARPGSSVTATHQIATGPGPQSSYQVADQPPAGSCHYRYTSAKEPLPDPACTPGATSPEVTQANLAGTVCKPGGYTSAVRPPAAVTGKEKAANARSYGYTGPMGDAEYDHLISLSLGGDPNDPRNLWVEPPSPDHVPGKGPNNDKDVVETHLHTALCKGQVTLAAVQQAITTDWTTAESRLGVAASGAAADPGDSE